MIQQTPPRYAVSDEQTKLLWQQREDIESFLCAMRERGAWQIESIRAIKELAAVSLGEAKEIVHDSKAWADTREASEALHASAFEALEQLERESDLAEERIAS